mgnify:CR=1 FL=1
MCENQAENGKTLLERMDETIARERLTECPDYLAHLNEFLTAAEQAGDLSAITLCHSLIAEHYYRDYDEELFRKHLLEASKNLDEVREKVPLAAAIIYNLMGIDELNNGNLELALEYYMNVIDISGENDRARYIAMNNIAIIYAQVDNHERCLEYLKQCRVYFANNDELRNRTARFNALFQYVECEYKRGNAEQIKEILEEIDELERNSPPVFRESPHIECARIYYYLLIKDNKSIDALMPKLLEKLRINKNVMNLAQDIINLCWAMLKCGIIGWVREIVATIEKHILNSGAPASALELLEFCIGYHKQIGEEEATFHSILKYYETIFEKNRKDKLAMRGNIDFYESFIQIKLQRNRVMRENLRLQTESSTDELTKLPNRRMLNMVAEKAFENAYNNQTLLGFEILDIDFFKQINDSYGHQYGDECLADIASAIRQLAAEDERIFAARYGGDEFCILYNNMTDEEIKTAALKLRQAVLDLKRPSPGSDVSEYLTISQGIRNSIPEMRNRPWDYMFTADDALYRVKNKKKGEILLVHSYKNDSYEWSTFDD